MVDATARFEVELGASAPGVDATTAAAERLRQKIDADQKAIRDLQTALKNMQGGASVNIEAVRNLRQQIDSKKAAVATASEKLVALGGSFSKTKDAAKEAAGAVKEGAGGIEGLAGAAVTAGGPIGGLVGRAQQLVGALGKAGVAGAAIIAAIAVLAIVGAVVAAVAAMASFALSAAGAARDAGLLREAATGSAAGAERLGKEIATLSGRIATPRAEIEQLALALARSGLQGNALETALSAIATTSAVMGQAAGGALQGIIDRSRQAKRFLVSAVDLQGTGIKIQELAQAVGKRLGVSAQTALAALQNGQVKLADGIAALDDVVMKKFGPIAARQMLSLPTQAAKAKAALNAMSAGVKIEGFLVAVRSALSLLDESSVSGKALKAVVETMLNPLFDAIAGGAPFIRGFFQGMIIGALTFAIGVLKVRNALRETFGGDTKSSIITVENALLAGKVAMAAIGVAAFVLTGILAGLAIAVGLVALPFLLVGAAIALVAYGIYRLVGLVAGVVENFDNLAAAARQAGSNFVTGLVSTISSGVGAVVEAVKKLADSAVKTLLSTLQIKSPSRVTALIGRYTVQGFVDEVDAGQDDAASAAASVGAAAAAGMASGAAGGPVGQPIAPPGGGGRGLTMNWSGDLYIGGRKALRDPDLESEVADFFGRAFARAGLA